MGIACEESVVRLSFGLGVLLYFVIPGLRCARPGANLCDPYRDRGCVICGWIGGVGFCRVVDYEGVFGLLFGVGASGFWWGF